MFSAWTNHFLPSFGGSQKIPRVVMSGSNLRNVNSQVDCPLICLIFGGSNLGVIEQKKRSPRKKRYIFVTKIDKVEQEIKQKLERSASKLDRPTSEMPGMHQPSAFSTKILLQ